MEVMPISLRAGSSISKSASPSMLLSSNAAKYPCKFNFSNHRPTSSVVHCRTSSFMLSCVVMHCASLWRRQCPSMRQAWGLELHSHTHTHTHVKTISTFPSSRTSQPAGQPANLAVSIETLVSECGGAAPSGCACGCQPHAPYRAKQVLRISVSACVRACECVCKSECVFEEAVPKGCWLWLRSTDEAKTLTRAGHGRSGALTKEQTACLFYAWRGRRVLGDGGNK